MSTFPRRADHFRAWAKLMLEQATVPDRPQYKGTSSKKSHRAGLAGQHRKRRRRKKRRAKREE